MNYSYEIITDSTANLPESIIDQYGIHVLPLSFMCEGKEYSGYVKGETTDLSVYYSMMREKKNMSTSLANSDMALSVAQELISQERDILYIGFSSGLSSTYQAVSSALKELQEEHPERKILYVDSLAAALGEGLLVYYAIQKREEGKRLEQTYEWILENRLHLCHWFTVDDLFFLKRGGRVSATTAIVGTALSVKPVLHVDNEGHLIAMGKVRGRRKSLDALVDKMAESVVNPEEQLIYISHGDCEEDANYVAEQVKSRWNVKDVMIRILDPVIGIHSGPGTVALFFIGRER